MRFAQDARFWDTKVTLSKSKLDIENWLRKRKAKNIIIQWVDDKHELIVAFEYGGKCIIRDRPLEIDRGRMGPTPPKEKAIAQMARRMLAQVQMAIDMADEGHPEMLDAYRCLPGQGTTTLQKLKFEGLMNLLSDANSGLLALTAGNPESDLVEVDE